MYSVTTPQPFYVRNLLELITALDNIDLVQAATMIHAERPFQLQVRDTSIDDPELEFVDVDYASLENYNRTGDAIFFYAGERPSQIMDERTGEWKEFSLPELLITNSSETITVTELEIDTDAGTHLATSHQGEHGCVVDSLALVQPNEYQ